MIDKFGVYRMVGTNDGNVAILPGLIEPEPNEKRGNSVLVSYPASISLVYDLRLYAIFWLRHLSIYPVWSGGGG